MKGKCHDCGVNQKEKKWMTCPSCKTTLCQNCHQKKVESERKDIERLREGDPHTRLQVLCPSCQSHMILL